MENEEIEKNASTAIILGATGLTGGILLKKLLPDSRYEKIILFSRRTSGINHPKIEEYLIDLFQLEEYQDEFFADVVFCCIGTTKRKTPDNAIYRKIDYGIPVTAAAISKNNNIEKFLVISALGADPKSKLFYNKTKGEMERDVLKQNPKNTFIFQPSLITGEREEKRFFESLGKQFMNFGNYLLFGPLKKYRSIKAEVLAEAMIFVAHNGYARHRIESDEIKRIAQKTKTK